MDKLPRSDYPLDHLEAVKTRKAPEIKGFRASYVSFLDINTTVSTWLDTSILMSAPPDVRGNKSSRFHLNLSAFRPVRLNPFVSGNISTAFGNPHRMALFRELRLSSSQPLAVPRVYGISSSQPPSGNHPEVFIHYCIQLCSNLREISVQIECLHADLIATHFVAVVRLNGLVSCGIKKHA